MELGGTLFLESNLPDSDFDHFFCRPTKNLEELLVFMSSNKAFGINGIFSLRLKIKHIQNRFWVCLADQSKHTPIGVLFKL